MPEIFDPDFIITIKYEGNIAELVAHFKEAFSNMITWWGGYVGQTEKHYVDFGRDRAYELGLTEWPYTLSIAGKLREYDDSDQKEHKEFIRSVMQLLKDKGCKIEFHATFSLD